MTPEVVGWRLDLEAVLGSRSGFAFDWGDKSEEKGENNKNGADDTEFQEQREGLILDDFFRCGGVTGAVEGLAGATESNAKNDGFWGASPGLEGGGVEV